MTAFFLSFSVVNISFYNFQLLDQLLYATDQPGKIAVDDGIARLYREIQVRTQKESRTIITCLLFIIWV